MKENSKKDKKINKEFSFTPFLKNNWQWIVLIIILILGIYLRLYHIDYPPIGYHNMKENDFLVGAKKMIETGDYLKVIYSSDGLKEQSYIIYPFPVLIWSIVIIWKIFGINVGYARMIIVLCSIANMILIYILAMKLTNKKEIGLIATLIMAILPLSVFFGRNIQPDIPGITFMLAYSIFFIRWCEKQKRIDFLLFSLFFVLAMLLKLTMGIGLLPLLGLMPYKKIYDDLKALKLKEYIIDGMIFLTFLANIPFWRYLAEKAMEGGKPVYDTIKLDKLFYPFTSGYWSSSAKTLSYFVADNFTWWFFWFAIIGIILSIFKFRNRFSRYIVFSAAAIVPYFMILNRYIVMHNYYQAPFLILVSMASAYLIYTIGSLVGQTIYLLVKRYKETIIMISIFLVMFISIGITHADIKESLDRQWDTLYYTDVAGKYINMHSEPNERVFLGADPSGQTYSVLWTADRIGIGIPTSVEVIKDAEERLDFRWIFLYGGSAGALQENADVWKYVEKNYNVAQIGLVKTNNDQLTPLYFVLKKGEPLNFSDIEKIQPKLAKTYERTHDSMDLYVIEK